MSRSWIGVVLAFLALLPALVLGSCGDRIEGEWDGPGEGTSLVVFEGAETSWQVRSIDLGKPEARPHLGEGWGHDESDRQRDMVWALGERATLQVFVARPIDVGLYLDVRRLGFKGLPPGRVTVRVNGVEVGTMAPGADFGTPQTVEVAADHWREGPNVIAFEHSVSAVATLHVGHPDGRPVASSWNGVALRGLTESAAPTAAEQRGAPVLRLPYGSQVSYYLQLRAGAELVLPRVETARRSGGAGRLKVILTPESGEPTEWSVGSQKEDVRLPLTDLDGLYRLTLRSLARPAKRVGPRGLVLVDPRVTRPAPPQIDPAEVASTKDAPAAEVGARTSPPNVLLYVIDTLRADHVDSFSPGSDRGTTPNLDALAEDGVLFEQARAQSSWTRPTMASILTGLYPQRHGSNGELDLLSREVDYLPEILGRAGFETAAVVTNGVVSESFGFHRGFDHFVHLGERPDSDPRIHQSADVLHKKALEWLDGRDPERPFFLYLHATDPHAPYRPPEPWRQRFAPHVDPEMGNHERVEELEWKPQALTPDRADDLRALYDAEIAFVDHQFGRLVSDLRRMGLFDDLLVVVVSDHGEEFGEHGRWQHGLTLNEEQLRVPLIVKLPAGRLAGTRVEHMVEQVDIAPTILDLTALDAVSDARKSMQGRHLLQTPADGIREFLALLARQPQRRHVASITRQGRKLIRYRMYDRPRPRHQLFDLTTDPQERVDLAEQRPLKTGWLRSRLLSSELFWRPATVDEAEIDSELERSLRALGYLD